MIPNRRHLPLGSRLLSLWPEVMIKKKKNDFLGQLRLEQNTAYFNASCNDS